MGWTQPLCDNCWGTTSPGREPGRLRKPEIERCCLCGQVTESGIYTRLDPTTVPYPLEED